MHRMPAGRELDRDLAAGVLMNLPSGGFMDPGRDGGIELPVFVGIDRDEFDMMDDDEKREALEEAGLDPDDFEDEF